MTSLRRTAVFVALSSTVGHELIFRHYTSKVVVGKYPDTKTIKFSEQIGNKREQKSHPSINRR